MLNPLRFTLFSKWKAKSAPSAQDKAVNADDPRLQQDITKINVHYLQKLLGAFSYFGDKINLFNSYNFSKTEDMFVLKSDLTDEQKSVVEKTKSMNIEKPIVIPNAERNVAKYSKIQYGSGGNILPGWLNVDIVTLDGIENYMQVDLTTRHPFKDGAFEFGFCEDFLEHLSQDDSIVFLKECYRTFKNGGVLRLAFPGLEGVLRQHCGQQVPLYLGKFEAYQFWDHQHFYSQEELRLVATHIGFKKVVFTEFGKSEHNELQNLETRAEQKAVNTYVELMK